MEFKQKYTSMLALAAIMLSAASCSDENVIGDEPIPEAKGKEVNFSISMPEMSRTYYDPNGWDDDDKLTQIFWGDITGNVANEQVMVYGDYAGRNIGRYKVDGYETGSSHATSLVKQGTTGVQWGESTTEQVHFYSVYPAIDKYADIPVEQGWLRTELTPGQSAKRYSIGGQIVTDYSQLHAQSTQARTIVANPDMSAAVMIADSKVAYGAEQVPLTYKMYPNVLELTIYGPTTELINGVHQSYVDILEINIERKEGSTVSLAGTFDYNSNDPLNYNVISEEGNVQIQTSIVAQDGTVYHPRLYNHGASTAAGTDKLKVRVFLLPNVKPSDITVNVTTNFGYYQLNPEQMSSVSFPQFQQGKIHRLRLPRFDEVGRHAFDYSRWMEQINPDVYVTELSLPGSWSSFSKQYQNLSLDDQYIAGIRAFTIKFDGNNYVKGTLQDQNSNYTLTEVIESLGKKVQNTKEYVVLILRTCGKSADLMNDIQSEIQGNQYVYQGGTNGIDPQTTVGDVAGKVIIKCNMDGNNNADSTMPAIFSKWTWDKVGQAQTAPLDWGTYENTTGTGAGNTGLIWCYTEEEAILTTGPVPSGWDYGATLETRIKAIDNYIEVSESTYNRGSHDRWFFILAGALLDNDASKAATYFNQLIYSKLSNPERTACPMGIVMMNFVEAANSTTNTYYTKDLIRTIIANNNAFIMAKKGASPATNDVTFRNQGNLTR